MVKVKILKTGEIKEVLNNTAHDLIEAGLAKLYTGEPKPKKKKRKKKAVRKRKKKVMRPGRKKKGYRTK